MALLDNLNFLTTIGTFGCISFALSGFGVKLGKYSSNPHTLGYSYISDYLTDETKKDKLYDAIAKTNKEYLTSNSDIPTWATDKTTLKNWCKENQKSTKHWKEASQHCLVRRNVWHQLILNDVDLKDEAPKTKLTEQEERPVEAGAQAPKEECTYELLNKYADDENHVDYLIGKRACGPVSTSAPAPQDPKSGSSR